MTTPHHRNNDKSIDTANEEWSEILTLTGASITPQLAPVDPTPEEVDVNKALSAQDLRSLKKQDPFLYYSIPGVRNAAIRFDTADNMHQIAQDGLRRNCASCPGSIQTAATSDFAVAKVKRCTRVSFECHTNLLLEDLFDDDDIDMNVEERLNNSRLGNDDVLADLFR